MPPTRHGLPQGSHATLQEVLLLCGVLYGLLYIVANDVVAAMLYDGYSRMSQAVSELSARGAPPERFLTALGPVFNVLLVAFGIGVWRSARGKRSLRITGGLLVAQGTTAFLWLVGPMSRREDLAVHGGAASDVLHIALSVASVVFIVSQIAIPARALGRVFGIFSFASLVTFVVFAMLTFVMGVELHAGEPTPWLGLIERIMLGSWLLWMAVLAVTLVRTGRREIV